MTLFPPSSIFLGCLGHALTMARRAAANSLDGFHAASSKRQLLSSSMIDKSPRNDSHALSMAGNRHRASRKKTREVGRTLYAVRLLVSFFSADILFFCAYKSANVLSFLQHQGIAAAYSALYLALFASLTLP